MMAPLAQRLREAAASLTADHISFDALLQAHGPAAHGSLLLLLAVPCVLPLPGAGTVLGIGIALQAVALWRGHTGAALPARVGRLVLPRASAQRVLSLLAALYATAGRWTRTRLPGWVAPGAQRWLAWVVGAMAVVLVLPIPLGNVLPAVALALIALGLVFRDGLAVALGTCVAALTTVGMAALAMSAVSLAGQALPF